MPVVPVADGPTTSLVSPQRMDMGIESRTVSVQFLLSPGNTAGECLPLNGSSGHVDIRIAERIILHAVTVEHLPRSLAFDITSAPKDMLVAGFADAPYLSEHLEERLPRAIRLAEFQYSIDVSRNPAHPSALHSLHSM